MAEGSTWQGDPRDWVILMSENGLKWQALNGFKSGVKPYNLKTLPVYKDEVWEANKPEVYESFANKEGHQYYDPFMGQGESYTFAIPVDAKIQTIETDGGPWDKIRIGDRWIHAETLKERAINDGYDGLRINGITEGPQLYLPGEHTTDDFIIFKGKKRKIITGNNGNLDPDVENNFGGLSPYLVPLGGAAIAGQQLFKE